jgi:hypothetical protein
MFASPADSKKRGNADVSEGGDDDASKKVQQNDPV